MGLRDKARESAQKATPPPPEKSPQKPEPVEKPEKVEEEPVEKAPPVAPSLEQSATYLVEEERPDIAYSLFISTTKQGMRGMVISRTYPKNLRKALSLGDVPIYWLTNAMSDEAIGPKDLERLTLTIRRFMEEGGGQVVLIDSLEYIITNNKFVSCLRLLQTIRDIVAVHKGIGIVSLKSSTLEPSRLASSPCRRTTSTTRDFATRISSGRPTSSSPSRDSGSSPSASPMTPRSSTHPAGASGSTPCSWKRCRGSCAAPLSISTTFLPAGGARRWTQRWRGRRRRCGRLRMVRRLLPR